MNIPDNITDKTELIDWLIANKSSLIAQKKATIKEADAISYVCPFVTDKGEAVKSEAIPVTATKIKVRSIINTTKLLDSHGDVHIDGLWNKSLKETKDNYLVNQHNFSFEGIISDEVKAFAKTISWKDLGYDYPGNTQALVYDSVVSKEDSPEMFEKYRRGKVKQHSVGMRYVKINLAVNDDRYAEEKAIWDKYINEVANKSDAEAQGYFWAVTEAKNIEGSAVVKGSNFITPTQSVTETKNIEPDKSTQPRAVKDTRLSEGLNNLLNLTKSVK